VMLGATEKPLGTLIELERPEGFFFPIPASERDEIGVSRGTSRD
jgi:hypothetical protein